MERVGLFLLFPVVMLLASCDESGPKLDQDITPKDVSGKIIRLENLVLGSEPYDFNYQGDTLQYIYSYFGRIFRIESNYFYANNRIDSIHIFSNGLEIFDHYKFYYEDGLLVSARFHDTGFVVDPTLNIESHFLYNSNNRINSQVDSTFRLHPFLELVETSTTTFEYDDMGNLISTNPGFKFAYDDKKNPFHGMYFTTALFTPLPFTYITSPNNITEIRDFNTDTLVLSMDYEYLGEYPIKVTTSAGEIFEFIYEE